MTRRAPASIFGGMSKPEHGGHHHRHIPDHVAQYLARRALRDLPEGVYEVLVMSPAIRKLVMQNVGASEIRDLAIEEGMLTLRMDAWLKVFKGHTNMEQMIRETSA